MPPWNEIHYARAQEFIGMIANVFSTPSATAVPARIPLRPPAPAVPAVVMPDSAPAPSPPLATPSTSTPPGPSAASVFKKIPWKK